ncbi:MAG: thioredoxin family protein [Syntrophobacteraceae bacterium]
MEIKVLGPGCKKCHETEAVIKKVLVETGKEASVEVISDIARIADYGVFATPGVVIDGKVKSLGKVPSKTEVANWLAK